MSDWQGIELVTPPANMPLPIGVVRDWVKANSDGADDATLILLTQSAVARAEHYAGMRLFTQTLRLRRGCFEDRMRLPIGPVQSITGIAYLDADGAAQTLDPLIYETELFGLMRPRIHLASGQSWPTVKESVAAVTVTAVAGFGGINDQPPDIRLALQKMIAAWFELRSEGEAPKDAVEILDSYRMPVV